MDVVALPPILNILLPKLFVFNALYVSPLFDVVPILVCKTPLR